MSPKQTIAFLGATGGCGSSCLAAALRAGHNCTARTSPHIPSRTHTHPRTSRSHTLKTHIHTHRHLQNLYLRTRPPHHRLGEREIPIRRHKHPLSPLPPRPASRHNLLRCGRIRHSAIQSIAPPRPSSRRSNHNGRLHARVVRRNRFPVPYVGETVLGGCVSDGGTGCMAQRTVAVDVCATV
jgi:hypothetical protein